MDELRERVYNVFRYLKPGQQIIIKEFAKKDPASFIQYGKDFIDEGNYNYEFTDGYKAFRRMYHEIDFSKFNLEAKTAAIEITQEIKKSA